MLGKILNLTDSLHRNLILPSLQILASLPVGVRVSGRGPRTTPGTAKDVGTAIIFSLSSSPPP